MFETPGTPWYAVSKGTLAGHWALIRPETLRCRPHHSDVSLDSPCDVCRCTADVFARGPVGENVLHLCVLFHTPETIKMAKYLIQRFGPSLVNAPYQTRKKMNERPGLYEGEVVLHIAIVHKDTDLVRFMLKHGARLDVHTIGAFFSPGRVYFGETPLSFAASIGDKDIVRILLDHAEEQGGKKQRWKVMTAVDAFGNTALHMCVTNNQLEMYSFLVDELGFPEMARNNAGMTTFTQAAYDGNERAFNFILKRRFSVVWTYGPVTNYSLSLNDIDTVGSDPTKHHLGPRRRAQATPSRAPQPSHPRRDAGDEVEAIRSVRVLSIFRLLRRVPRHLQLADALARHSPRPVGVAVDGANGDGMDDAGARHDHARAARARPGAFRARVLHRQLETLSLISKTSEVPLYCLPGQRAERLTNEMQMPRALKIVRPRRGTEFAQKGSITRGESKIMTWKSGLKRKMSISTRLGTGSKSKKAGYVARSDTLRQMNVLQTRDDDVYVMEVSVVARRRWRMIREHWISQRSCVRPYQIIRQRDLIHSDDYDDRVTVLLHVHVLEARGLRVAGGLYGVKPYCAVTAAPGVRSVTHCLRGTRDPRWNRAFSFTAPPGIRRSANALTFAVASHDEDDEDDGLGTACVSYNHVPYIAPGMIPPGPVWLDLNMHDEAVATIDRAVSITAPVDVGAPGDEVTTATVVVPERPGVGIGAGVGNGGGVKDASERRNWSGLGQLLAEVYYEVCGLSRRRTTTRGRKRRNPSAGTSRRRRRRRPSRRRRRRRPSRRRRRRRPSRPRLLSSSDCVADGMKIGVRSRSSAGWHGEPGEGDASSIGVARVRGARGGSRSRSRRSGASDHASRMDGEEEDGQNEDERVGSRPRAISRMVRVGETRARRGFRMSTPPWYRSPFRR